MKNPNFKSNDDGDEEEEDDDDDVDDDDDDETLRRGHMARVPFGGGFPFSWSFKDKGSSPPLCFAK